jgi:hypothetical protein
MIKTETPKRPTHRVYAVKKISEEKSHWTEIGAAWSHQDGKGFSVKLEGRDKPERHGSCVGQLGPDPSNAAAVHPNGHSPCLLGGGYGGDVRVSVSAA